ncbi:uncharacterized protein LOC132549191 [Ylistrum balloti]|uniref:uncharacterized protein LOC132549191 n=1 Tax=Ylistrum balloti TaxID=509963 RepID=UPI002905974E|nr:uncharacterized protein LOC132549191 [Ylistrum balloti]
MAMIVKMAMLMMIETFVLIDRTFAYRTIHDTANLRVKALNMTGHIQNETHQMLIVEYMVHCTTQPLCTIGSIEQSDLCCCKPCSCDDACLISGNCCIDKALAENGLDILNQKGSHCVLSQLKPFQENGLNTNDHFLMRGRCHKTFLDTNIIMMCYNGQLSPTSANLTDYLPVSSSLTGDTYRNKYCAYCNWEQDDNLTYWETSFSCGNSGFVFPHKARQLLNFIIGNNDCNIFYHPPSETVSFPCSDETTMITECNVTGLWADYDSSIEWTCENYRNGYMYDYTLYKNVFCYICNTMSSPAPLCLDGYQGFAGGGVANGFNGLTSFAALFNFIEDPVDVQVPETSPICNTGFRFDTFKNVCREITCLPPFTYRHGVCESVFSLIAFQRYEMFLRFRKSQSYSTNCDICPRLAPRLIQEYVKIHLKNMGYYDSVCGLTVLFTNDSCSSDTGDLVLHIELSISYFHNPIDVAKDFLNSSAFHLESAPGAFLCVDTRPEVLGGKFYELEAGREGYEYVYPIDRDYKDPSSGEKMSVEIYHEAVNCPFKPWVARLVPSFVCPHVNLSLSDFNITGHTNELCFHNPKKCFQPDEYTLSSDMVSVLICEDDYFASPMTRYTPPPEEDLGKELVSIVCSCLSVICLILTLITYILFPVLRTLPGLFNLALCVTLIVGHVLFTFGAGAVQTGSLCEIFGIIIHFTMLAGVFLMNVCSIHMFHVFNHLDRQYVLTEEEKKRYFLISLVYSYGSSAVFVCGRIIYSVVNTGTSGYGIRICFINEHNALLFTFTLPVMLLVVANIFMFCIVIVKVSRLPDMSKSTSCRHHQKRFLIYVKLSTLTGAAWLFGFIAEISHLDVFVYISIILIAGQGILIMLSFVCNKRVYNMYVSYKKGDSSPSTSRCHTILSNTHSSSSVSNNKMSHKEETTTEIDNDRHFLAVRDNVPVESSTRL